jgi:hypothetical protein
MSRRKRFFNWCPEPQAPAQQMLRQYSKPILAVLIITIIAASAIAAASLGFSQSIVATPALIDQTIRNNATPTPTLSPTPIEKPAVTPAPTINNAGHTSTNPNMWPNSGEINKSVTPTPIPLIPQEQAIEIAMPLINQYAADHNRTITTITASFSPLCRIPNGSSLSDPFQGWLIEASYVRTGQETGAEYYIFGYQVIVRAENGQVAFSNVEGYM